MDEMTPRSDRAGCPETPSGVIRSLVPARMDRLPWASFHSRLVIALGVAWVLDGLEITIASLVGPVLQSEHTLHLSSVNVGRAAPVHLGGYRAGALFVGPMIGLAIWRLRGALPESPRWLLMHGYAEEAERTVTEIERQVEASGHPLTPVDERKALEVRALRPLGYVTLAKVLLGAYPSRSMLSLSLMISQSFLYNAIFFTYGLVLTHFYGVPSPAVPKFFFAFAAGNLLGPLTMGRLFDTAGRKQMIAGTYGASGLLLAVSG